MTHNKSKQRKLRIFLLILIIIGLILLFTQKFWVPKFVNQIVSSETPLVQTPVKQTPKAPTHASISITSEKIKEANFSGTMAVISGTSQLAVKMREYIKAQVDEFRTEANTEVPDMIKKFGAGSPPATYTIDINSKYIKSGKADSIVTDVYTFTGGAHGSTIYKVITATLTDGKILSHILSLSDIIKQGEQSAFTDLVKKELIAWRPEGSTASVVFPDEVSNLTFDSFANWSLGDQNLTIYFDQDTIGPGVLGATAFPIPLVKIKDFMDKI